MVEDRRSGRAAVGGVTRVRTFYDQEGWRWVDGMSGDARRWGTTTRGPIQAHLDRRRTEHLRRLLRLEGPEAPAGGASLIEFGGGGQPATSLLAGVRAYTAVDISAEGLKAAKAALAPFPVEVELVEADVRAVPLPDGTFDAAYCAHMIYHVPTAADQRRVLREMARVVRPGGTLAVVMSEPYPWLFPGRCLRRAVADTPVLGGVVRKLRPDPPLPFLPLPSRWMCEVLADLGTTSVRCYSVPTTAFSRRVDERNAVGRLLWSGVSLLETHWSQAGRRAGCYCVVALHKHPAG
ncbi:MAG: class I SAM-dependent methyltransferase [Acidimicrobiales bacterium]